jgi:Na+/proline symporter
MAQSVSRDLLGRYGTQARSAEDIWPVTATLGAATMILSLNLHSSVFNLALASVSLLGAGLAPVMMIRVLNWRRTDTSLIFAALVGFCTASLWRFFGLSGFMNEAAPGIALALSANLIVCRFSATSGRSLVYDDVRT